MHAVLWQYPALVQAAPLKRQLRRKEVEAALVVSQRLDVTGPEVSVDNDPVYRCLVHPAVKSDAEPIVLRTECAIGCGESLIAAWEASQAEGCHGHETAPPPRRNN